MSYKDIQKFIKKYRFGNKPKNNSYLACQIDDEFNIVNTTHAKELMDFLKDLFVTQDTRFIFTEKTYRMYGMPPLPKTVIVCENNEQRIALKSELSNQKMERVTVVAQDGYDNVDRRKNVCLVKDLLKMYSRTKTTVVAFVGTEHINKTFEFYDKVFTVRTSDKKAIKETQTPFPIDKFRLFHQKVTEINGLPIKVYSK